ncbi:TonB-linked outer membrane protein, SusC/RagA family [Arachidicoccus rhizosphaerae]|uniref:TonB-linked outer membrane protein, SusC/RagA family n=1 Tax=Arachidicoccus rhizosphaerae TaxID=551991 RepID=A0A1H3Y629_9BACT|nr:TonB-dependent receptor [Arachidicoccus rhizosphaerae]SEA07117.1 TonB-linked outer membrane protein, SusC/RagA family [Arachidicoccus rhizosphaerae]
MNKFEKKSLFSAGRYAITRLLRQSIVVLMLMVVTNYAVAQSDHLVHGVVVDEHNLPVSNVSVQAKNAKNGTITNAQGEFRLEASSEDSLVFSLIGNQSQTLLVGNRSEFRVVLISNEAALLNDVVVVGYGTQKKSDLTGSVSIVNVEDMKKVSNSNMSTMLEGRVAGVNVTTDGEPGADPTVRIRGIGSFGDVSPLYVVDGVPVGTTIRDFSPNDIESMQVLKDASAAAIYGSRAANGVVIITTKHGLKNTKLKVNYAGYVGMDNVPKKISLLGTSDYQKINNLSRENAGLPLWSANDPTSSDYISPDSLNTDWQNATFVTGMRQDHALGLSGGGENSTYNISMDYYNQQGTFTGVGPKYNRYTLRMTNTTELGIFKFNVSGVYSHSDQNTLNTTNQVGSFFGSEPPMVLQILTMIPTMPVYDASTSSGYGSYNTTTQGEMYSLNMVGMNNMLKRSTIVDRMLLSGTGEVDFGKLFLLKNQGLKYKLNVSWDKTYAKDFNWVPTFDFTPFYTNTIAKLDQGYRNYTTALIENILTYTAQFGRHNLEVTAGQTYQNDNYNTLTGHGEGFAEPYKMELSNAESTTSSSYSSSHYISSLLGRLNYNFDEKYLLSATIRRDGSSRFSEANRFGYFPSVSVGWKINKEKFFRVDEHIISELKLRASYGVLGNENIGEYAYLQAVNRNYVYNFNNSVVFGGSEASVVDDNLKWESKKMTNIGLDMSLFDHQFDFTAEYYKSRSSDLLVGVNIPLSVGSLNSAPTVNAGTMDNSGLEFSATYRNHKHEFKYDISANASTVHNKVISLGNNGQPIYGAGSRTQEGQEVGRQFGYVYEGIFQTADEVSSAAFQSAGTGVGDIKFKDLNGDGTIDASDRTDLGSSLPHLSYGLSFMASYKNLDFSIMANGVGKFLVDDAIYRSLMHSDGGLNWSTDILNSWSTDNTSTNIPRVVYVDENGNGRDSDRPGWLQNGAYTKISTISIGYTVPTRKIFSSFRAYVTCQNVYTFSDLKDYNPDFSGGVWNPGYNYASYPTPRTFMIGVNFNLK